MGIFQTTISQKRYTLTKNQTHHQMQKKILNHLWKNERICMKGLVKNLAWIWSCKWPAGLKTWKCYISGSSGLWLNGQRFWNQDINLYLPSKFGVYSSSNKKVRNFEKCHLELNPCMAHQYNFIMSSWQIQKNVSTPPRRKETKYIGRKRSSSRFRKTLLQGFVHCRSRVISEGTKSCR